MSDKIIEAGLVWTRVSHRNNMLLENDKFYISYNPVAGADKSDELGTMAQVIGGLFNGEGDPQEETALYDGKVWRILLGDFRKEYEEAYPKGLEACIAVYDSLKAAHRSEWSTDHDN